MLYSMNATFTKLLEIVVQMSLRDKLKTLKKIPKKTPKCCFIQVLSLNYGGVLMLRSEKITTTRGTSRSPLLKAAAGFVGHMDLWPILLPMFHSTQNG
jgi:hypothetical protein